MATAATKPSRSNLIVFVAGSFLVTLSIFLYFIGGLIFGGAVDYHDIEYVVYFDEEDANIIASHLLGVKGELTCYSSPNFANPLRFPFTNDEDYHSGLGLLIAASVCFFAGAAVMLAAHLRNLKMRRRDMEDKQPHEINTTVNCIAAP